MALHPPPTDEGEWLAEQFNVHGQGLGRDFDAKSCQRQTVRPKQIHALVHVTQRVGDADALTPAVIETDLTPRQLELPAAIVAKVMVVVMMVVTVVAVAG